MGKTRHIGFSNVVDARLIVTKETVFWNKPTMGMPKIWVSLPEICVGTFSPGSPVSSIMGKGCLVGPSQYAVSCIAMGSVAGLEAS